MHEPVYSYAQNREDVLLWRALKDVPSECGKWIDVGANDPLRDSVTQLFSIRGWSGINVEPVRSCFDRLCQWRSRDVNILGACSDSDGPLRLFRVADNTALSTADLSLAAYYRQANRPVVEEIVQAFTLTSLIDKNEIAQCHFLKIDVEGHERQVLEGMDFTKMKPWIVVIEATEPKSWCHLLEEAGYQLAQFDGLNLIYTDQARPELAQTLKLPVNSHDSDVIYCHPTDTHKHTLFVKSIASKYIIERFRDGQELSSAEEVATEMLGLIVADRADLTGLFVRDEQIDILAILQWAITTPPEQDSHLPLLVTHQPELVSLALRMERERQGSSNWLNEVDRFGTEGFV